jgi:hypothetical protein
MAAITKDNSEHPNGSIRAMFAAAPSPTQSALYIVGHMISGFIVLFGDIILVNEAMNPTSINPYGTPAVMLGIIAAITSAGADLLIAKMPLQNTYVAQARLEVTVLTIFFKLFFSGPAQSKLEAKLPKFKILAKDSRQPGAVVNCILVIPALAFTCYHFYELAQREDCAERNCAIMGQTACIVQYMGRVAYMTTLFVEDPETRLSPAAVYEGANLVLGGLETGLSFVK